MMGSALFVLRREQRRNGRRRWTEGGGDYELDDSQLAVLVGKGGSE